MKWGILVAALAARPYDDGTVGAASCVGDSQWVQCRVQLSEGRRVDYSGARPVAEGDRLCFADDGCARGWVRCSP